MIDHLTQQNRFLRQEDANTNYPLISTGKNRLIDGRGHFESGGILNDPPQQTRHLTTDIDVIDQQITKPDNWRKRRLFRADEKRVILRIYFALSREAKERREQTGIKFYARVRRRTARFVSHSARTASTIITS